MASKSKSSRVKALENSPLGKIYTTKEVSEFARMDVRTIQRAITSGKLKAHKIGKVYRIAERDLLEWWEETKME